MENKTEADSNDITECPHDDKPTTGMFGLLGAYSSLMSYVHHKNFRTTTFVRRLRRIHKNVRKLFCVSYVRISTYESFQAKLYVSIK